MNETKLIPTNRITVFEEPGRADSSDQDLTGLIKSIQEIGLLHPITVIADGDQYRCVAGARRLAAVRSLLWENIAAIVRLDVSDDRCLAVSAMENLERKQLTPLDEAFLCKAALDFLETTEKVAETIGRTALWVNTRLAILQWPEDCIVALRDRKLSMSAIGPLASIDQPDIRKMYLATAIDNGATAKQTLLWMLDWRAARNGGQQPPAPQMAANGKPAVPQKPPSAPCLVCGDIHNLNTLAHLPLCPGCLSVVRQASAIKEKTDQSDLAASNASETEG